MTHPDYLQQRARDLRTTRHLSVVEIAERLALPKTTVWYWIRDLPLGRPRRSSPGQRKGNDAMQKKYRLLREEAYEQGRLEYDELVKLPTFRDFVALYVAEGCKRNRNRVSVGNSDERVVALCVGWLRRLSARPLRYAIQYHADQDLDELRQFWGEVLGIDGSIIRLQRKSNSGQLRGRQWRCAHGVMSVTVYDTCLRARFQAWIDRVRDQWGLNCAAQFGV